MKIVVFTYDRYDTATTPKIVEGSGLDFLVVCHTEEMRQKYLDCGTVTRTENIVASNVEKGLANNRNWYIDKYLKDGEWCLMLVDDLLKITELDDYDKYKGGNYKLPISIRNSSLWGRKFRKEITFAEFIERCEETKTEAERLHCKLAGFAGIANPLFRPKKWKWNSLADGRAWLVCKTGLRCDPNVQMVDDVCFCAQNIERMSGVLVNQWVLPDCRRYTGGAFGSITERTPQKLAECKYLTQRFKGLVECRDKLNWEKGSHVAIKHLRPKQLQMFYSKQLQRGYVE